MTNCRHCGRPILIDRSLGYDYPRWYDPEATGDDEIWRYVCDENQEDRIAAHEPVE
jgi:hypothetical protein